MAEQKESSVLFSLKELMNLEEDRIKQEESEREAAVRREMEAKAAAERAAREAEEQRLRDAEQQRRMEEQQRREEDARLEAIRHAEVAKARTEAEHRARMEALAAQQAHEQQLAVVSQDKHKKRLQIWIAVITGVLVVGGITAGVLMKRSHDEQERRIAAAEAQKRASEEQLANLKRDFESAQNKEQELRQSLSSAKDEAERNKIEAQLAKARKARQAAGRALSTAGSHAKASGAKKPCHCPPGDPLCSCL